MYRRFKLGIFELVIDGEILDPTSETYLDIVSSYDGLFLQEFKVGWVSIFGILERLPEIGSFFKGIV